MPDKWYAGLRDSDGCQMTSTESPLLETPIIRQLNAALANTEMDADQSVQVADAVGHLTRISDTLAHKVQQEPTTYLAGCQAFVRNFDSIRTTSGLLSALHGFGKYSGAATSMVAGRKRRKAIAFANKRIGVQPTAIARRSMKCFGRRAAGAGRPSKLTRASEHGYNKVRAQSGHAGIPARKTAAPHNLQECVGQNV